MPPSPRWSRSPGTRRARSAVTSHGSTYFRQYNTGKTSLRLDLNDADERARLDGLLGESDAVVMNFSPRTLRKHGLDWSSLHRRFPRLVVVLISAYGDGDERTAFDSIAQAVSWLRLT